MYCIVPLLFFLFPLLTMFHLFPPPPPPALQEPRVPLRLLMLKTFAALCELDPTVVGILLSSVLPNELGRDIQQGIAGILWEGRDGVRCRAMGQSCGAMRGSCVG